jgi:predicted nucleotidyltransferase
MKTDLDHLPQAKREQIQRIVDIVRGGATVEMIVLFGSHARGDWVRDPVHGYFSDFDFLVIVATDALADDPVLWASRCGASNRRARRARRLVEQLAARRPPQGRLARR